MSLPNSLMCVLHVTNECNLLCTYCYKSCESYKYRGATSTNHYLSYAKLARIAEWILKSKREFVYFQFHGGEPTLAWNEITNFITTVNKFKNLKNQEVAFGIQTNGLNWSHDKLKWATANGLNISVSFDGTEHTQNLNRPYGDGNGSYHDILEKLKLILSYFPDTCAMVTVVQPEFIPSILENLIEIGFKRFGLSPAYDKATLNNSVWCKQMAEYHLSLAHQLVSINLQKPTIIEENIKQIIVNLYNKEPLYMCHAWPCGAGTKMIAVDIDSKIYPCDEFFGDLDWSFGDFEKISQTPIDELLTSSEIVNHLSSRHFNQIAKCDNCDVSKGCGGSCTAQAYFNKGTILSHDPLCVYFKHFIKNLSKLVDENPIALPMLVNPWKTKEIVRSF